MAFTLLRHPGVTALAILIPALLVWGFWPQPVLVEPVAVIEAPLTVTIEEEGRTLVRDRYVISAPVDGVACRIRMHVGDPVEQGQVLLTISPLESSVLDPRSRAEAQARAAAARSALESARDEAESVKAASDFYSSEVRRLKPLLDRGVIAKGAYDKAQMDVLSAAAKLRSAGHAVEVALYELQAAETVLNYTAGSAPGDAAGKVPVVSPINGQILKVHRKCEGPLRTGEALLEVGDTSMLEVQVDVLSPDAVRIGAGMQVLFERWGGAQDLQGLVRLVEPVGFTKISALGVEEQRVLVIVDFTSPPELWRRLGDGYRVVARFVLWHRDKVLQVPASSLFRYRGGYALFVIENGRAVRRVVSVGERNGLAAQVLDGVKPGEFVVNHPSEQVEDGSRVMQR
jgi:HlyD family secretion protein